MADTAPTDSLARKTITLVLAEAGLRGPTEETLDPEVRRRILARYFTIASQVFSLHGASLERPARRQPRRDLRHPRLHEDDALRAVQAALELREALVRLNEELERERGVAIDVRIGIDTGEVLESGSASPGGLVSGEPLGAAGRLAQAAGPGQIVISEATYGSSAAPSRSRPPRWTSEAPPVEHSSCSMLPPRCPHVPTARSSGVRASFACSSRRSRMRAATAALTSSRCSGHPAWASRASRASS